MPELSLAIPIVVIAIGQTAFVVLYVHRPWWRHFVGRALFSKSSALMVLVLWTIARWFIDDAPWVDVVTTSLYWGVGAAVWFQLGALIVQQHEDRRHEGPRIGPRKGLGWRSWRLHRTGGRRSRRTRPGFTRGRSPLDKGPSGSDSETAPQAS